MVSVPVARRALVRSSHPMVKLERLMAAEQARVREVGEAGTLGLTNGMGDENNMSACLSACLIGSGAAGTKGLKDHQ
jgi:hypothetical protein